jgi:hypothetical protein
MRHGAGTMSSAAPGPGTQGTMGGPKQAVGSRPGRRNVVWGDEVYLWILVAVEVGLIAHFRNMFSRYHGG